MIYWIIYDISDDKVRSKVASKCKDYGLSRVQKSAFLGSITRNKAEMLALEFQKIIKDSDCLFILPACNDCFSRKIIQGKFDKKIAEKKDFTIVGK